MAKRRKAPSKQLPTSKKAARGRPFPPGVSGNPSGARRGRNLFVEAIRKRVDADTAAMLTERLIKAAKTGSISATTFLMRHLPKHALALAPDGTKLETASDAAAAINRVAEQVIRGELAPSEATEAVAILMAALTSSAGVTDFEALLRRIAELKGVVERRDDQTDMPWSKPDEAPEVPEP
jgi:hypothetical protein